jgi:hypothetical protein
LERKTLIDLDLAALKEKHEMKMSEFVYIRETERLKHEWELERNRIKSAEIRKAQERGRNR